MGLHGRSSDYRDTHRCDPCTREHVADLTKKQREDLKHLPNPDPDNWKIERAEQYGKHLVLTLLYPDCTNHEGKKTMLYRDLTLVDLVNQKRIDPHFANDPKVKSPFARFEPTDDGWYAAVALAAWLTDSEKNKGKR